MGVMEPDDIEDDEEAIDFGEFRPIRIRGIDNRSKKDKYGWDDDDG